MRQTNKNRFAYEKIDLRNDGGVTADYPDPVGGIANA
jgi:hypothetical protein